MSLRNETALITGATSGIGYELAKLFAKDNANLVIVGRNDATLNMAAEEFRNIGSPHVNTIKKDLTFPESAWEIYQQTHAENIRISFLVNDAGVGEHGYFFETDLEKEDRIIRLNIISLVHLTKFYLQDMIRQKSGKILNLASIASYQPTPTLAVYSASKAFVLSFTDALIYELKDTGVTMTALIPGPTDTDFFNKSHMQKTKAALNDPEDPAKVALAGYKGLMEGKHHVAGSLYVQSQIAMSAALPNEVVTSQAAHLMEEKR